MQNTQQEPTNVSLNDTTIAEKNQSKEPLNGSMFRIDNTPFWVTGDDTSGYFGIMGKHQITETMPTRADVINYIYEKPWQLLITICHIIFEYRTEITNLIIAENKK